MNKILNKLKGKSTRKAVAIAATLLLAVLVSGLAACSAATLSSEVGAGKAIQDAAAGVIDEARGIELPEQVGEDESADAESAEAEEADVDGVGALAELGSEPDTSGQTATASGASGNASAPSQKSESSSPASSNQTPSQQKKWVEDTEQVWVEDRAAWSEQVPVYGTKEVSICNICGQDITGNTSVHGKAHMLAGEGSGHHSEVRQVVTGYNTVSHPAEGHWETRVVGGHWE